MTVFIK